MATGLRRKALPVGAAPLYQAAMGEGITRRRLLIGGGAGMGLLVAWAAWPRRYAAGLAAAAGETVLGPFLKIGEDGRVTVIVPQAETGQGIWTALAQIAADELGADWRTVAVEPAPVGPLYANRLLADILARDVPPAPLRPVAEMLAPRWAAGHDAMMTALSTSVRGFAGPMREAGAAARVALCMAAAKRWGVDWRACGTERGFVVRGADRLRFGELAAQAAGQAVPDPLPLRAPGAGGIVGKPLPRLDIPGKIDGSVRFAADVRLPDMVFAAIRQAPPGNSRLVRIDKMAAHRIPDLVAVFENPGWVAVAADNWWAANRALDALAPRFETTGDLPDDASIAAALEAALATGGHRVAGEGEPGALLGEDAITADYAAGPAAHAALETPAATARLIDGRLELWAGTQAPAAARAAAARATGIAEAGVTLYPMPVGGGFGTGLDLRAVEQAAILAKEIGRPVQLMWSRGEADVHDPFRPPARAKMTARVAAGGGIAAWHARIAAPASLRETAARLHPGLPIGHGAEPLAAEGALPRYAIPATAVDHHPVDIGLPTGMLRGEAAGYATFFTECFVDELAAKAGLDPLSFRIDMLGADPRLARCLIRATALGGWAGGGAGSAQGIACFAGYGSLVAVMAQVRVDAGSIVVERLAAAADCGRMANPDLVRAQIEGGLLFALPATTGEPIRIARGLPDRRRLGLPTLAAAPELRVELVASDAPSGGASGLAVPPVAAAIGNALFSATGHRCRHLPLSMNP